MIQASLNFYLDPQHGGHTSFVAGTAGAYRRKFDEHTVSIKDIRGREQEFSLQKQGFQYCKQPIAENSFEDDDSIKSSVYFQTERLIKQLTGATRVHIIEHSVRRASRDTIQDTVDSDPKYQDDNTPLTDIGPARFAHIDFSNAGSYQILHNTLRTELANSLSRTRWAIINVWRPLKPITKDPLAVCDSLSVEDEDLIPIPMGVPGRKGWDVYYLKYKPNQSWYYLSAMEPDDVLLFKCFDSTPDKQTVARRVPHSSFVDPKTKDDVNRQSIELRCLVFFEDQSFSYNTQDSAGKI